MAPKAISIIGAGLGGLTLARSLLKRNIPSSVTVYERVPSTSTRHGYSITLHGPAYQSMLDILGIEEGVFRRKVGVEKGTSTTGEQGFRVHRRSLESLLREGVDVRWGCALQKVELGAVSPAGEDSSVRLHFQDGQPVDSDFLVGADGVHSVTRKSLLPDRAETPFTVLPFVVFNGKRHVPRDVFDEVYAPAFVDSSVISCKTNDAVLKISVEESAESVGRDEVSISYTYSRPARSSAVDNLFKPNRSISGAVEIPEEFYHGLRSLQNLEEPFREVFLEEEKLKSDRVLHWLMRAGVVELEVLQEMARRGVYFLGDAVHSEPIVGGEGANTAIMDAVGLAEWIAGDAMGVGEGKGVEKWYEMRHPKWKEGIDRSERTIAEMHNPSSEATTSH